MAARAFLSLLSLGALLASLLLEPPHLHVPPAPGDAPLVAAHHHATQPLAGHAADQCLACRGVRDLRSAAPAPPAWRAAAAPPRLARPSGDAECLLPGPGRSPEAARAPPSSSATLLG